MLSLHDLASVIPLLRTVWFPLSFPSCTFIMLAFSVLLLSVFYLLPTLSGLTTTTPLTATLARTIQSTCSLLNQATCYLSLSDSGPQGLVSRRMYSLRS